MVRLMHRTGSPARRLSEERLSKMANWKSKVLNIIAKADEMSDNARSRIKRFTGHDGPLIIHSYFGHGTAGQVVLKGRVLEDQGLIPSEDADTNWENLVNLYKRFESDEVPGARLRVRFGNVEQEVTADGEGYFSSTLELNNHSDTRLWQEVDLELLKPLASGEAGVRAAGWIMIPPATAKFGVISDIDDTVIVSNVINKFKLLLTVALSNERTRMPFEGVASFYRALQDGASGGENNPIFYVSKSPWNLYTLLVEFFDIHGIPRGPLFLRDFGSDKTFPEDDHKVSRIESIVNTYPDLPFVLVGDSGERDPEIYRDVVKAFPNRIRTIYIRSVNPEPSRIAAIDRLAAEVQETQSQLILAPDTEFAATHAAAEGMISTGALAEIRSEKRVDQTTPSPAE
jgi:phosphatidate phosphatase APP1